MSRRIVISVDIGAAPYGIRSTHTGGMQSHVAREPLAIQNGLDEMKIRVSQYFFVLQQDHLQIAHSRGTTLLKMCRTLPHHCRTNPAIAAPRQPDWDGGNDTIAMWLCCAVVGKQAQIFARKSGTFGHVDIRPYIPTHWHISRFCGHDTG
jgi:hypothetical protein